MDSWIKKAGGGLVREWRKKLERFMIGRYGVDAFARFLNGCILFLLVLQLFIPRRGIYFFALLLLFYNYFRIFSKNIPARFRENEVYQRIRFRLDEKLRHWRGQAGELRKYHIYRCPGCGQKLRIPRGRGKVQICCPKCHTEFVKRS